MDENGVSRPETVKQLRSALKNLNLTVAQVIDKAKQIDANVSDSTIRRILSDTVDAEKNFRPEGIKIVSDIIYGDISDDFDPQKARMYFDECRELRQSINELKIALADTNARLEHFRELTAKDKEDIQFFKDEIMFLRDRLTYISPKKE